MEPVEAIPEGEPTTTEAPQTPLEGKKPRSHAQLKALEAAREKALRVRRENAELRQKEKAVKSYQKQERVRQVEQAYDQLPKKEAEEQDDWDSPIQELPAPYQEPKPKKKRKPARRVIVTEVSSESDHSDVEVVLPKKKPPPPQPTAEEMHYQRAMERMFTLAL